MADLRNRRSGLLPVALLAVCVACISAGALFLRHHVSMSADGRRSFERITLMDQDGAERQLSGWAGKLVVLDFIFTGCGDTCPLKTAQLADVQQSLPPDVRARVQFVSVSIDPEHDRPPELRAYAQRNGASLSDWTFLTGNLARIAKFAAAFDTAPVAGEDAPSHITTIRLLDPSGRVLERYVGEPVDTARLSHDIAALATNVTNDHAGT